MNIKTIYVSLTHLKAFVFFVFVVVVTSACTQGSSSSTVTSHQSDGGGITVPTTLRSLSADNTLTAYIQVDDGEFQQMSIIGDNATISLTDITEGNHTFTVKFEYTSSKIPGNPVILVRASKMINVMPGDNALRISESDYKADIFDEDGDGASNLVEMLRGSNLFPDITVSTISGDTTEEGTTASFTVVLTREPANEVTVGISSSDETEGMVDNTPLTFSTTNWDTAQTVTVTGLDDDIVDDNQPYSIILAAATSDDDSYNEFKPDDVTLTNISSNSHLSPSASNVSIVDENAGSAVAGDNLTGSYTPVDAAGTFTYQWLRNGMTIDGAQALTYTLVSADSGQIITFEVTPVTTTGVTVASRGITVDLDTAVLSVDFGIKQLQFSWPAVNNATYYRLMENTDGASDFTRRSTNIITTSNTLDIAVHRQDWRNVRYLLQACNSQSCSNSEEIGTLDGMLSAIQLVKASNARLGDQFGTKVALSSDGNTLAVGARGEKSDARGVTTDIDEITQNDSADKAGAVYIFSRSNDKWEFQAYIKASNAEADDFFGISVSLSGDGNTLAAGAFREDSDGTGEENNLAADAGAVYVFSRNGSSWEQQDYIKASSVNTGDWFGISVALSHDGNTLAAGAPGALDATNEKMVGAVYVFNRSDSGSNWVQQPPVKAFNPMDEARFGHSVALNKNGDTLVVGAQGEDSDAKGISTDVTDENSLTEKKSGAVYVFSRSTGNWSPQVYVKASNANAGDQFGNSVALSSDGNTFAVGAYSESSDATGISTDETGPDNNEKDKSGAVYVFSNNNGSWFQQAYVKASNSGENDWFGRALALSSDGNTLVVGARREESNATGISTDGTNETNDFVTQAGAVYVFGRNNGSWSQQTYVKASDVVTGNLFGSAVALSGDGHTLAVGARGEKDEDNNVVFTAGAVYLY